MAVARLGPLRALEMVDPYATGIHAHVLHMGQEIHLRGNGRDPWSETRIVCRALGGDRLGWEPQHHLSQG